MALKPLQAGKEPLGQFDGLDTEYLTLKGGECGTFGIISLPRTDKAVYDAKDGYTSYLTSGNVVITKTLASGARPIMLLDEGTLGYGTTFGVAIGGVGGQVVVNPSDPAQVGGLVLGPHTAWGSGKVTCWDKPGLYAVTLDAVAADLAPTTALNPGAAIYATSAGLLTSVAASSFAGSGQYPVARFVEFSTKGSLVTTPSYLAGGNKVYTQVVIHFNPGE